MTDVLRRVEGRFSAVQIVCDTAVCIGGGPSLTAEQCAVVGAWRAQGTARRVIGINDAYLIAPFSDVCYFADGKWWEWHRKRSEFRSFLGQKCSLDKHMARIKDDAVHILRYDIKAAFSDDPRSLARGDYGHSGFQVLNMAALAGAQTIVLLGYDAREPRAGAASHWFGEHPEQAPVSVFSKYRRSFSMAEAELKRRGIRVLNASPGSAIESFPKVRIEDALA